MIRNFRVYIAVQTVVALCALLIPPRERWARNLTDRQLWTIKGTVTAALVIVAAVIIFHR